MFDVGFSELLLIAVVALLVLGPERLPKAARFAGLWVRRARAQWNSVRNEFERELADDELKRTLRETQASLRDAQQSLREAGGELQREFTTARDDLMRGPRPQPGVSPPPAPALAPALLPGETAPEATHAPDAEPAPEVIWDPPLESVSEHSFDLEEEEYDETAPELPFPTDHDDTAKR
jgi:sec-independent protein translocase protein TatB